MKSLILLCIMTVAIAEREYVVDLNLPPANRYDQIVKDHKELILEIHRTIKGGIRENIWINIANVYRTVAIPKYREYAEEIAGIAKILNISAQDLYVVNCFYEIAVMCTSIVARDKNNKLILARNLDFGFTSLLRQGHIIVHYKRNNKVIAQCGNIAGYIGVFTCLRPGAFAASINARLLSNLGDFISRLRDGKILTTWLLREAILNSATYNEAVERVSKARTVSASYIIFAGLRDNEGTVITRGRDSVFSEKKLSRDTWFLAKCNSDDNVHERRTDWANEAMTKLGQKNTNLDAILNNVLSRDPLLRSNTVATILMSPVDGYYKSIIASTLTTEDSEFP